METLTLFERIQTEKARRSLYEFCKQCWPILEPTVPFTPGWHLEAICEHLEAVTNGQIQNLLINVPPRHSKSLLTSVMWPVWEWITSPDKRFLCSSYALSLSVRDSRKSKLLIESDWYQRRWGHVYHLMRDQSAKMRYENNWRGYRLSVSTESAATGEGGDRVVCIDYKTLITTNSGNIPIGDIVEQRLNVQSLSFNQRKKIVEYKPIVSYMKHYNSKVCIRVTLQNEVFVECTDNHQWHVENKGYVPTKELQEGDIVLYKNSFALEKIAIRAINPIERIETVYNIEVEDNHNYFANGILLKNCDDPHNVRDSYSQVKREGTLLWWDTTMSTRLNNQKTGAKVIIMQRVAEGDLSGHVLSQGGYVQLMLPAEYEPARKCFTSIGWTDPRQKEGELLWPAQIGPEEIQKIKRSLGPFGYASQYQQSPVPVGGAIFKREYLRYFYQQAQFYVLEDGQGQQKRVLKNACWLFATVDLAASEKTTADYTVICTWAVTPDNELLLLEMVRDRLSGPKIEEAIAHCYHRFHHSFFSIESVAFQLTMTQKALHSGIPTKPYKPLKDKVSRAISASTFYANGQVYHLKHADYLLEFEPELLNFPKAQHDDTVDCVSAATEICFNPNQPNIRTFDDEPSEQLEVAAMERGFFLD